MTILPKACKSFVTSDGVQSVHDLTFCVLGLECCLQVFVFDFTAFVAVATAAAAAAVTVVVLAFYAYVPWMAFTRILGGIFFFF